MKYCKNCGKEIADKAVICPHCGVPQEKLAVSVDSGNFGWWILGFFFPVVGLILYFLWKETKPKNAKKAKDGAATMVIWSIFCYVMFAFL